MSRIFSNPLIELAEFEELSRDIARKRDRYRSAAVWIRKRFT